MKNFLYKTLLFLLPFIVLAAITSSFFSLNQGDLLRVGYLMKDNNYRTIFNNEYKLPIYYDSIYSLNTSKRSEYTFLTIGDSFAEQTNSGFKNYLAKFDNINVLHINNLDCGKNPFQTIYGVINGDLLNKVKINCIILQSAQSLFVLRSQDIDKRNKLNILDLNRLVEEFGNQKHKSNIFPPTQYLKFPLFSILYNINNHAFFSDVYKVKLKFNLFSGKKENELLFPKDQLNLDNLTSDSTSINKMNKELCDISSLLKKKGINLIVLPSPSKFDIYYNFIVEKDDFLKPNFFQIMKTLNKNYIYIDSYEILTKHLPAKKDLYYFDDSHWSPWAAQILAKEIAASIDIH